MTFLLGPALLFCPADRPDRYAKAAERADAVILDLEDSVAPERRAAARESLLAQPLDPDRTIVRINSAQSADFRADLAAVTRSGYRTVMLPKVAGVRDLAGFGALEIIALCETAAGIAAANRIAEHPNVVALMWGAEDLVASLGGTSSRFSDGRYRHVARHARSVVLLAAGAAGRAAIDAVHLDIADLDGLAAEAEDAAASGFASVACIHPGQVDTIRAAFRPSEKEIAAARELLAAADGGVFQFGGRMIDGPVLAQAAEVIRRAGGPAS
jgi:citrate lyase subunit beta/citryl-CoA lyase